MRFFFRMPPTPEQESRQTEIELKGDDPDALEDTLRRSHGFKVEMWHGQPWEYWLDLMGTADKYLEPGLSIRAAINFENVALSLREQDIGMACGILDVLQDVDEREPLKAFGMELAMKHLKWLSDERFIYPVYSCIRNRVQDALTTELCRRIGRRREGLRSAWSSCGVPAEVAVVGGGGFWCSTHV
jgi:hypothetical protein